MSSVPFLPGYSFPDPTVSHFCCSYFTELIFFPKKTNFAKTQTLGYKNGYALGATTTPQPLTEVEGGSSLNLAGLTFTTTSIISNSAVAQKTGTYNHPSTEYYKKVQFHLHTSRAG